MRPSRLVIMALLAGARLAGAHPLGQTSVDHFSRLQIASGKVMVIYELDLAEVGAFQESKRIDANGDGVLDDAELAAFAPGRARELAANLRLEINRRPLALTPLNPKVFIQPGEANLPTLRLITVMETAPGAVRSALAATEPQTASFRDDNDPGRIGWRQIGVIGLGPKILDLAIDGQPATVSPQGYATNAKGSDIDVRAVEFRFAAASAESSPPPAPAVILQPPRRREADPFAALMTAEHLTPAKMLLFLLVAAGLGGLHALSPGHGKTLVAAYLVGARGTVRHALVLGLIVTLTHTAGVFALGLVTLFASRYLLPETLYPWLRAISGLTIALIGLFRLFGRAGHHHHHHDHAHDHAHDHDAEHAHAHAHHLPHEHHHDHPHGHSHLPPPGAPITWRSLLALGVSGGLAPCPSALVVLLGAISLHQVRFGLVLILAFSVGLAGILTLIGVAVVHAQNFLSKREIVPPWLGRLAPRIGAVAIVVIGLAIAFPAAAELAMRFAR